jgi:glyoxylase-like metal-dependent hydrolase (beta-lactamase superfamily II)/rhodanese-related sulfurtransferase
MFFKQFFVEGLGLSSYLIGSRGVCAIIDPRRDVDEYVEFARENRYRITHIFETHLHADFISGHIELAKKTGAKIYAPEKAKAGYDHVPIKEGDVITLGTLNIKVIESPGHTPEMINLIVADADISKEPCLAFTGDTLFVGDVGRPDLFGPKMVEKLTKSLYVSLYDKLWSQPDWVEVYPAHGPGSLCGKNISAKLYSTIGFEKISNPAYSFSSYDEFKSHILEGMPEPPSYFFRTSEINRKGPAILDGLPGKVRLSVDDVNRLAKKGSAILDTRSIDAFAGSHIAGAINIGIAPALSTWAGNFIPYDRAIVLILENEKYFDSVATMLIRVGLDNIAGYLAGGMTSWHVAGMREERLGLWSVDALKENISIDKKLKVIDVRTPNEWNSGHIKGAIHLPIMSMEKGLGKINKKGKYAIVCGSGYRASIASSILMRDGVKDIVNISGGMTAWNTKKYPVEK